MRAFSKQYRYMTNEEGLMSELPSGQKKHFAAGLNWANISRGDVRGFVTADEAHAHWHSVYPKRWVVSMYR